MPSKFGIRYTFKPSIPECLSPFMVIEKTAIAITSIRSAGISIFDIDSIPLFTPMNMITATAARNTAVRIIGSY